MEEKNKSWVHSLLYFIGEFKPFMILSVISAVSSVICGIIPYFAISKLITGFLQNSIHLEGLIILSLYIALGYILQQTLFSISTMLSHKTAFIILKNIRKEIAEKLIRMPMGKIYGKNSGQYKELLVDMVERMEFPIAHLIPELTSNMSLPILIIVYLCFLDIRLALCSIISIGIGFLLFAKMMSGYGKKYCEYATSCENLNSTIIEYVNGIEVIKAFGHSTSSYKKYTTAVNDYKDYTLQWYKNSWKYSSSAYAIMPAVLLFLLPIGGYLFSTGSISFSTYIVSMILSLGIAPPIMKVVEFADNIEVIKETVSAVDAFFNEDELEFTESDDVAIDAQVELKYVSFSYNTKKVINNISFISKAKQLTAIVGPSGSGKSTIAKLIMRFWDCNEGAILLGNKNIKDISQKQLMKSVSYVSQDNFLFNISIKDNIRLGNPKATDEEIYTAAKKACCHDFILNLANKYETLVGDAGSQLSGGERQRITIARAILKNAPIILLDEATAYTDPENEEKIKESISTLTEHKTVIVIAHRLSSIINADNIVVLNNGSCVGQGTHEELLNTCTEYKSMWSDYMSISESDEEEQHA